MESLLIVEDEVELGRLLKDAFRSAGYDVRSTQDALEVNRLCRAKLPDLVITDIYLPTRGGLELVMDLRQDFPTVKIIVMSGHATANDLLPVAQTLGADRSFLKPFHVPEMVQAVREVLDQDREEESP